MPDIKVQGGCKPILIPPKNMLVYLNAHSFWDDKLAIRVRVSNVYLDPDYLTTLHQLAISAHL